ncbi:rCG37261, partial [Rattus norvegicus]
MSGKSGPAPPNPPTCVFLLLPVGVQSHDLYRHRVSGNCATTSPWRPHLMSLHVLLDVRLLGKGTATCNALEGLFPRVAVGT